MCGIAGIVSLTNQAPIDPELITQMCDSISHRGPDGEGFLFSQKISEGWLNSLQDQRPKASISQKEFPRELALGHRRLSIIDLSQSASQPMQIDDGNLWIIFNGEIYNHDQLRKELIKKGHRFHTNHSDTEVILHAYREWGKAALDHFRGMFAFALYDAKRDLLWLVRDRMGIKPLYYTVFDGRLYFGSEIKAILCEKRLPRRMNYQGLYDYFTFLTTPPPHTLFEGISKLPAGYELTVQNGKISTPKKYWDVYDGVRPHIGTEAQIMEELDHLLRESVALRKQSDVPYGVYLSGGVDSSANVAFLADQVKEPVKTFSVGYENNESHSSYKNEFPYSRMVADRFQCDRHEIEITQHQFIDFSSNLTKFIDEPNADIVTTSLYYVSQLAKDSGVTVCLGGEGSDELFCGYIIWRHSSQFSKAINISKKLGAKGLLRQAVQAPLVHSKRPFYRNWLERLQYGKEIFWGGAIGLEEREKRALFSPTFLQGLGGYSSWESIADWHNDFEQTCPQPDALNWMSYLDLKFRLPDLLLHRLDKMSMAASIEARVPFLDSKLIQFAMGIPTNLKIRKQEEKYILKKTLEKRLPKEIIYRNKIGFGAPIREWFGEDLGALAHKKILHFNRETHLFRPEALEKWLQGRPGAQSWQMFVVALWWEKYFQ